jgi:photosystem II stability/assembly factor-like uncharacterized protein
LKSILLLAAVGLFIWLGVAGIALLAQSTVGQGRNFVPGDLASMSFVDAKLGWSVAANCSSGTPSSSACRSVVYATTDGGRSWSSVGQILLFPRRMTFVDAQIGWLVGSVGRECGTDLCQNVVMRTEDGGRKWTRVSTVAAELTDVAAVSPNDFWAVGRVCPRNGPCSGALVHTTSAGQLWENGALPIVGRDLRTGRVSQSAGWVARADVSGSGPVLATTMDSGATWKTISVPCASGALVDFTSADEGWLACSESPAGATGSVSVSRTVDGGATWQAVGEVSASNAAVQGAGSRSDTSLAANPLAVRAVAPGDLWLTLGSGEVMRAISVTRPRPEIAIGESPRDVRFVDAEHGWLLGLRSIWRTTDGGTTWEQYRVQAE